MKTTIVESFKIKIVLLKGNKVANHYYSHGATVELSFVLIHNQTDYRSVGPVFAVNVLTL